MLHPMAFPIRYNVYVSDCVLNVHLLFRLTTKCVQFWMAVKGTQTIKQRQKSCASSHLLYAVSLLVFFDCVFDWFTFISCCGRDANTLFNYCKYVTIVMAIIIIIIIREKNGTNMKNRHRPNSHLLMTNDAHPIGGMRWKFSTTFTDTHTAHTTRCTAIYDSTQFSTASGAR